MQLPADQVKLENAKAHLQQVLVELSNANNALSTVFSQISVATKQLGELRAAITVSENELAKAQKVLEQTQSESSSLLLDVSEKQKLLLKDKKDFALFKAEAEKRLDDMVSRSHETVMSQAQAIKDGSLRILSIQSNIEELQKKCSGLERILEAVGEAEDAEKATQVRIATLNETIATAKENHKAQLLVHAQELEEAAALTQEERDKIELPRKALLEGQQALIQKERDMLILKMRLQKGFEELYPGKTFNIAL